MHYSRIVFIILTLWSLSVGNLFATSSSPNPLDTLRQQPIFRVMEAIKTRLREGEEDKMQKGVLANALFQYALTGRLPPIPALSDLPKGHGLSSRATANVFQKTLIIEAIIVANLYKDPATVAEFVQTIIFPATLEPSIAKSHKNHAALSYLFYIRANGQEDQYQGTLAWYRDWYKGVFAPSFPEQKIIKFLDTFVDGSKEITFEQLVQNTKAKYGPQAKVAKSPRPKNRVEGGINASAEINILKQQLAVSTDHAAVGKFAKLEELAKKDEDESDSPDDEPESPVNPTEVNATAERIATLQAEYQAGQKARQEKIERITKIWESINASPQLRNYLQKEGVPTAKPEILDLSALDDFNYQELKESNSGVLVTTVAVDEIRVPVNEPTASAASASASQYKIVERSDKKTVVTFDAPVLNSKEYFKREGILQLYLFLINNGKNRLLCLLDRNDTGKAYLLKYDPEFEVLLKNPEFQGAFLNYLDIPRKARKLSKVNIPGAFSQNS